MFYALSMDRATKLNGFRYALSSTSTQEIHFKSKKDTYWELSSDNTIFIGGDKYYESADIWLQNVRLYSNYFPDSEGEMINLAIRDSGNICYTLNRNTPYFFMVDRHTLHCSL